MKKVKRAPLFTPRTCFASFSFSPFSPKHQVYGEARGCTGLNMKTNCDCDSQVSPHAIFCYCFIIFLSNLLKTTRGSSFFFFPFDI